MSKVTQFDREHVGEILAEPLKYSWLACHIIRLAAKAAGEDRELLRSIWPDHVEAFERWRDSPLHARHLEVEPAPPVRPPSRPQVLAAAAAIANARGCRRGAPAIENVLEVLPPTTLGELMLDAEAALAAAAAAEG